MVKVKKQTSPSPVSSFLDISESQLYFNDPLGKLFFKASKHIFWRTLIAAFLVYGFFIIGGGILISQAYEHTGAQFVSIKDYREMPIAILAYFVTAPLLWILYTEQPRWIVRVFHQLHYAGSIDETKTSSVDLIPKLNKFIFLIPFLAVVTGLLIWLNVLSPSNPFYYGQPAKWWQVNLVYFWAVWIPLTYINIYILIWIIIRQMVATIAFSRLFAQHKIKPRLFHPDECNGLAAIGDFSIYWSSVVVFFGFWLFVFISYPILFGQSINFNADTMTLLIIYVLSVPLILLLPVWKSHLEMSRAKTEALNELATQIETLMNIKTLNQLVDDKELLLELERRYIILKNEYHTWPFRPLAIKRLVTSSLAPVISTGITYVLDKF